MELEQLNDISSIKNKICLIEQELFYLDIKGTMEFKTITLETFKGIERELSEYRISLTKFHDKLIEIETAYNKKIAEIEAAHNEKCAELNTEIEKIKAKAAAYGVVAGTVMGILIQLGMFLLSKI